MPMQKTESIYRDSYLTIPRSIFLDQELSLEAMVLYSFLLDRTKLSEKNKLIDEQGIFVYCSIEEAAKVLRVERKKAIRVFRELIDRKWIYRIRQGLNKANKYYVRFPAEVPNGDFREASSDTAEVPNGDFREASSDTAEVPNGDFRKASSDTAEVPNGDPSNNKSNNNNLSNKESSHSSPSLSSIEDPFLVTRLKCRMSYFRRLKEGESKEKLDEELRALLEQAELY